LLCMGYYPKIERNYLLTRKFGGRVESTASGVCYGTTAMVAIGGKLAEIRHARLLTQQELADAANLSVQTIRALEGGHVQHPRRANMKKLADALGVVPLDLADPSLTAAQVLRRADRSRAGGEFPAVASLAPLPLSVSMLAVTLGPLLEAAHGIG
jgi:transcriptional regulator with XRE-family HTH domain